MAIERPRFRPLEAVPYEEDGHLVVHLRDPEGISTQVAALPPPLAQFLFEMCDGTRTCADIEAEFARLAGREIDLSGTFEQLDRALFFDSPRFRREIATLTEEYRRGPARPVAEMRAYPDALRDFLDGIYEGIEAAPGTAPLRALAIPHLDLRHGGRAAARGLAGLPRTFSGDTIVILGVGHRLARHPYALSGKDYETPVGTVPAARDLLDRVVAAAGSWVLEEELVHKNEHSVEYAATLLRHALPDREFRILPVVCGSFHEFVAGRVSPGSDPRVGAFIETLSEEAGDALVVASVDLAHMGPAYGDPEPLTADDLEEIERADREMLTHLARRDAEGFFGCVVAEGDRRRVCGLSALYTTLSLLPPGPEGRLEVYEQPVFPEEGNTVTICSMAWERVRTRGR